MAGSFRNSNKDSVEISELAALNEDISDDLIDQLQSQISSDMSSNASKPEVNINDDATLFEETVPDSQPATESPVEDKTAATEPSAGAAPEEPKAAPDEPKPTEPQASVAKKENITFNADFDDNFIKKYKAKLNKKAASSKDEVKTSKTKESEVAAVAENPDEPIESLSQGNISERPLTKELRDYNDSLDFLDGNVKYSKYVIYIDPQNVDFIESLTVKERKNLINSILRQQDDIAITKQRFKIIQTTIRQVIIAIITVAIAIPFIYHIINASLESTIENHRRSQTNWQTLYREHGKITQN